jgi:hypothetical protein
MDEETIFLPEIKLEWSRWYPWDKLLLDARTNNEAIKLPNESGVYEAKIIDTEERLTIGKASNIRMRVKQGLVKGKVPHSSGDYIRNIEDKSKIIVRWALTDRPAAVEEELHRKYIRPLAKVDHLALLSSRL